MENIVITGITGQDGLFLTKKILNENKNVKIFGTSRQKKLSSFYSNLNKLGVDSFDRLEIEIIDLNNLNEVSLFLDKTKPKGLYNLTGPSSVYDSYKKRKETTYQITNIFNNLTNSLIKLENFCNFFQASSSEIFEDTYGEPIDENTKLNPNSPYAEGKLINHYKVLDLSKNYDWNIVSGIMFNHESEFRGNNYLTSKVIKAAHNIYCKNSDNLEIGSLDYVRDWSYASDVTNAMHTLVKKNASGSYIIGSGEGHTIKDLVNGVFNYYNLPYEKYIKVNKSLLRDNDPISKISNPSKILNDFGWKVKIDFETLIINCIKNRNLKS